MKNLVDLLNKSINESNGVVYGIFGGYSDGESKTPKTFDDIYMFTSSIDKAKKICREEDFGNEDFDFTFYEEVPCNINLNRFVATVCGYSKKKAGFVKVISLHNKEKDANNFIKNMSEEEKLENKKLFDIDSYEVLITMYEK